MKRIVLTIVAILFVSLAFSQQVAKQTNFSKFEKKIEKSTAEISHPKKGLAPKTWANRGKLMQETYEAMLLSSRPDMTEAEFTLIIGQPNEKKQDSADDQPVSVFVMDRIDFFFIDGHLNSWKYTKPVFDEPLTEALNCFKKAIDLDPKKKIEKKLKEDLIKLSYNFVSEGSNFYTRKEYDKAYDCFFKYIEIGEMPIVNNLDSTILYYAGLSAHLADNYDAAIDMYKKSIAKGYAADGNSYYYIFDCYNLQEKPEEGLSYLENGFTKYPKNLQLLYGLINFYISKGEDSNKVLGFIQAAKKEEPDNASLYFAEGTLYDQLQEYESAMVSYAQAIELNPNFFDAIYNLGALHYNNGVRDIEEANKLSAKEIKQIDELEAKAKENFKKSLPFMERAHEVNPTDASTLESLKNLYFRFRNEGKEYEEKYKDVVSKIDAL